MPKLLIAANVIICLLLGAALMYVIESGSRLQFVPSSTVGPTEFISIILSALGVILAAMALLIGVLAIVGWNSIQNQVERKIKDHAGDYLSKRFSDDNGEYLQFVEDIKEDVRVRLLEFTRELQVEWEQDERREQVDPNE